MNIGHNSIASSATSIASSTTASHPIASQVTSTVSTSSQVSPVTQNSNNTIGADLSTIKKSTVATPHVDHRDNQRESSATDRDHRDKTGDQNPKVSEAAIIAEAASKSSDQQEHPDIKNDGDIMSGMLV